MSHLTGVDLSHWNGKITSYKKLAGSGFVVHKATEGTSYIDPRYAERAVKLRKAGARFGSYHFASGLDAGAEARHFVKTARPQPGEMVMLDIEAKILNMPGLVAWCVRWIEEVRKLTGILPVIYMSSSVATRFNWAPVAKLGVHLWAARYAAAEPAAGAFGSWSIWQYTSKGSAPGVVGNVDLNRCKAGITWKDLTGATPAKPKAEPTPPPPAAKPVKAPRTSYTVRAGDTLSKIASRHGITWQQLVRWNGDRYPQLISNPDLIEPGQKLVIVAGATPANRSVTVKAGDTLAGIAARHKTNWRALVELNHARYPSLVKDPGLIHPGWVLYLP